MTHKKLTLKMFDNDKERRDFEDMPFIEKIFIIHNKAISHAITDYDRLEAFRLHYLGAVGAVTNFFDGHREQTESGKLTEEEGAKALRMLGELRNFANNKYARFRKEIVGAARGPELY